jgi:hypothetical protein
MATGLGEVQDLLQWGEQTFGAAPQAPGQPDPQINDLLHWGEATFGPAGGQPAGQADQSLLLPPPEQRLPEPPAPAQQLTLGQQRADLAGVSLPELRQQYQQQQEQRNLEQAQSLVQAGMKPQAGDQWYSIRKAQEKAQEKAQKAQKAQQAEQARVQQEQQAFVHKLSQTALELASSGKYDNEKDYAESVAQQFGGHATPEFAKQLKPLLDAFGILRKVKSASTATEIFGENFLDRLARLTPKSQRAAVLVALSYDVQKAGVAGAPGRVGGKIGAGLLAAGLNLEYLEPGGLEQWRFKKDALNILNGQLTDPNAGVLQNILESAPSALVQMGIAHAGPAGVATTFGLPGGIETTEALRRRGADFLPAAVAGTIRAIGTTVLFHGTPARILSLPEQEIIGKGIKATLTRTATNALKTGTVIALDDAQRQIIQETAAALEGMGHKNALELARDIVRNVPEHMLTGAVLTVPSGVAGAVKVFGELKGKPGIDNKPIEFNPAKITPETVAAFVEKRSRTAARDVGLENTRADQREEIAAKLREAQATVAEPAATEPPPGRPEAAPEAPQPGVRPELRPTATSGEVETYATRADLDARALTDSLFGEKNSDTYWKARDYLEQHAPDDNPKRWFKAAAIVRRLEKSVSGEKADRLAKAHALRGMSRELATLAKQPKRIEGPQGIPPEKQELPPEVKAASVEGLRSVLNSLGIKIPRGAKKSDLQAMVAQALSSQATPAAETPPPGRPEAVQPEMAPEAAPPVEAPAAGPEAAPDPIVEAAKAAGLPEPEPRPEQQPVEQPPAEPQAASGGMSGPQGTSFKHAILDAINESRGKAPDASLERTTFQGELDRARQDIASGKVDPVALTQGLIAKPRAIDDAEKAALTLHLLDMRKKNAAAHAEVAAAHDSGDAARLEQAQVAQGLSDAAYDAARKTYKLSGSMSGKSLAFQKLVLNEDESIETLRADARAAKGGKPLEPEEEKRLEQQSKELETQKARADKAEAELARIASQKAADAEIEAARSKPRTQRAPRTEKAKQERVEKWNNFKEKFSAAWGSLGAAYDPKVQAQKELEAFKAAGELIASYVKEGVARFSDFLAQAKADFGDDVLKARNQLKQVWDHLDRAGKLPKPAVDVAKPAALNKYAKQIVRDVVESGVTEHDAIIDAVHDELRRVLPEISRNETYDAIAGKGLFQPASTEETSVRVAQLTDEAQKVVKLREMEKEGTAPSLFGRARQKPSDLGRQLGQQVHEAKKKGGFLITDPVAQAKSALEAAKTYLRNRMVDLNTEMDAKQRTVKERRVLEKDQEWKDMRAEYDELLKAHREMFPPNRAPLTDAQQLAIAERAITRSNDKLEADLKAGKFGRKGKGKTWNSATLEAERARRDALKKLQKELRNNSPEWQAQEMDRRRTAKERMLDNQIRKIESDVVGMPKPKPGEVTSPSIQAKQARLARLKAMREKARDENPAYQEMVRERQDAAYERDLFRRLADAKKDLAAAKENPAEAFKKKVKTPRERELSKEAEAAKIETARVRLEIAQDKLSWQRANRKWWEKTADVGAKLRRFNVLSYTSTLGKLTAAAASRYVLAPVREAAGGALGTIPGLSQISERAPIEGGADFGAMLRGMKRGISTGLVDAVQMMIQGRSNLELTHEGKTQLGESNLHERGGKYTRWLDVPGQIHAAMKAPVKRMAYEYAVIKATERMDAMGIDVNDPMVQLRIETMAFKFAERQIFLQDNVAVDKVNAFLSARRDPATGRTSLSGKTWELGGKVLLPIRRVPVNIVHEVWESVFGLASGTVAARRAYKEGIDKLSPEDADIIMRKLKNGLIGDAVMLTVFLTGGTGIGIFYQRGRKEDKKEPKEGEIRVGPVTATRSFTHFPLAEVAKVAATISKVADSKLRKKDREKQGITNGILAGLLGLSEELPAVRETLDLSKAYDPHSRGAFFGELTRSTVIPGAVQEIAKRQDTDRSGEPVRRKPEGIWQHIETGIPGLRKRVPFKRRK